MDEDNRTEHGDNICNEIQGEDAYGDFNVLTQADVWNILDNLQTHFMDHTPDAPIIQTLGRWMHEIE